MQPEKKPTYPVFWRGDVTILASDLWGVSAPQQALESLDHSQWPDMKPEDIKIVEAGPDHEHYWEAWADISATEGEDDQGRKLMLYQDGYVFLLTEDPDGPYLWRDDADLWEEV